MPGIQKPTWLTKHGEEVGAGPFHRAVVPGDAECHFCGENRNEADFEETKEVWVGRWV